MSRHGDILDAVQATLVAALGDGAGQIDGIASGNVKQAWLPAVERALATKVVGGLPAIFVCPIGIETIGGAPGFVEPVGSDDRGYPCVVAFCAATDQNLTAGLGKYLDWREIAINLFHNQRLSG